MALASAAATERHVARRAEQLPVERSTCENFDGQLSGGLCKG